LAPVPLDILRLRMDMLYRLGHVSRTV